MDAFLEGARLVFDPYVLMVMVAAASYGISIGAIPGLTATMAVALLIPITFHGEPDSNSTTNTPAAASPCDHRNPPFETSHFLLSPNRLKE